MNNFKYLQPENLNEAAKLLIKNQNSIVFAGGTDVLGLMKDNIISPEVVVNLKKLPNLNFISYENSRGLEIGALTSIVEIADNPVIKEKYSILSQAASEVASPQLRNMGTIGGNLCQRPRCFYFRGDFDCIRKGGSICFAYDGNNKYHAIMGGSPCYIVHPSDIAVALLALNAKLSIFSKGKSKEIPVKNFFILPEVNSEKENILENGDILEKIIIPELPPGSKSAYIKIKERGAWDFAVVSVGAVLEKNTNKIKAGRIAFGGVAPIPWENEYINEKLQNLNINEKEFITLADNMFNNAEPLEMNSYKVIMAKNLMKRILINLTS